jgi:predicted aspartyl protease
MFVRIIWGVFVLACVGAHQINAADCKPLRMYDSIPINVTPGVTRIYVPVEIAGVAKKMIFDTGAEFSILKESSALSLGLSIREGHMKFFDLTGQSTAKLTTTSMKIGRIAGGNIILIVSPTMLKNEDVDGVLGADILSHFDISADLAGGKLDFLDPNHCEGKVIYWPAAAIAKIPLERMEANSIIFKLELDGKPVFARLDTGAPTSTIRINTAQRLFGLRPGSAELPANGILNGRGDLVTYTHTFKTLSFEGVTVNNPTITLIPDMMSKPLAQTDPDTRTQTPDETSKADILLGMDIMRHVHFYIAYKEKALYITPAEPAAKASN